MSAYDRSKVVLNNPQQSALHSRKCQIEKVEAQLGRGPEPHKNGDF